MGLVELVKLLLTTLFCQATTNKPLIKRCLTARLPHFWWREELGGWFLYRVALYSPSPIPTTILMFLILTNNQFLRVVSTATTKPIVMFVNGVS